MTCRKGQVPTPHLSRILRFHRGGATRSTGPRDGLTSRFGPSCLGQGRQFFKGKFRLFQYTNSSSRRRRSWVTDPFLWTSYPTGPAAEKPQGWGGWNTTLYVRISGQRSLLTDPEGGGDRGPTGFRIRGNRLSLRCHGDRRRRPEVFVT